MRASCLFSTLINHTFELATLTAAVTGKAVWVQGGEKNSPSYTAFPISYSQLTVWQHNPVYYSGGLYHVVVRLIPRNAWNCQTGEVFTSPVGEKKKITKQSCRKYIWQKKRVFAV